MVLGKQGCKWGIIAATIAGIAGAAHAGSGSCCEANGTVGCNDETCEQAVCDCDPFCCEVEWDSFCAGEGGGGLGCGAALLCGALCSPAPANDACENAQVITGTGMFAFDNTTASTDGLPDAACDVQGFDQIERDVWYCWTAPCSGDVFFGTCGSTVDTKIAVYEGCGCPTTASPIVCGEDQCGVASSVQFVATAGQSYLLRLGTFPAAQGGAGTFEVQCLGDATPPEVTCSATPSGEEAVVVDYAATDDSGDVSVTAIVDLGCDAIEVTAGQTVQFVCTDVDPPATHVVICFSPGNSGNRFTMTVPQQALNGMLSAGATLGPCCGAELVDGVWHIESESAVLRVVATDGSGNTSTCEVELCE